MAVGVSTACFFGKSLTEDSVDKIAEIGAEHIEVFLDSFSEYDTKFAQMLQERINRHGMTVTSVHTLSTQFEPQVFSRNARQQGDARRMFERVFACANILGATRYVFHGPPRLRKGNPLVSNYELLGRNVSDIAELAKEYGIRFTWENVHWCAYSHPEFARRLREHVASDNLYFTLDMKQAAISGYDWREYLDDMGDRLINVHVCDYRTDDDGDAYACMLFTGELDVPALRDELVARGYDGPVMLEVYSNDYGDLLELGECFRRLQAIWNGATSP